METLLLTKIQVSKTNPRKYFDEKALAELTESVKKHGVLQPVLVRPLNGDGTFELVAGERRYRAAKAAGLKEIPAVSRELDDKQTLEVQVIENLQRSDLHAMEEADGYRQLLKHGYDAAKIAERVGRSTKYVYDRIKLLNLIPELAKVFLENKITAGHAILLARLSPKDQERASGPAPSGLWEGEALLWNPNEEDDSTDPNAGCKVRSVRELQAWIDENVKFDKQVVDPMLFPETAEVVQTSAEAAEPIVQITHDHYVRPDARDPKERIISPRSWKRADGSKGAKTCEHAVTGIIVVGYGRGDAFKVCIEKKKCKVHWKEEIQASAQRAKRMATGDGNAQERYRKEEERRKAEEAKREAERQAWKKAIPAMVEAVAAAVRKAPTKASGLLAKIVLDECQDRYSKKDVEKVSSFIPLGTTADDLIRHAAWSVIFQQAYEWDAPTEFPKIAKAFGIDVSKLLGEEGKKNG